MTENVTLAIDTVRDRLQLALALSDGQVLTMSEPVARGHAEIVMDRIASLLARAAKQYADIDRIAVLTGPGSFTGVRIGLSVARGLGLALRRPVLGIPTLTALSLDLPAGGAIVLDARREEAFIQRFLGPAVPAGPLEVIGLTEALAALDGASLSHWQVDIGRVALFARMAAPGAYPPDPAYVRAADAKPQTNAAVRRA